MDIKDTRMTPSELLDLALEALGRSGFSLDPMHPEDLAAALTPAIEAVAVGFGEGYQRGLRYGRAQQ